MKNKAAGVVEIYHKTFTGLISAPDGTKRWFINGAYGRPDDLPSVEYLDGTQCWYAENPKRGGVGQRASLEHREHGPALIRADGSTYWYIMGKLHRSGGLPAVELADGTMKWFENGVFVRWNGSETGLNTVVDENQICDNLKVERG